MYSSRAVRTAESLWGPQWSGCSEGGGSSSSSTTGGGDHEKENREGRAMRIGEEGGDLYQTLRESLSEHQISQVPQNEAGLQALARAGHWKAVVELAHRLQVVTSSSSLSLSSSSELYTADVAPALPSFLRAAVATTNASSSSSSSAAAAARRAIIAVPKGHHPHHPEVEMREFLRAFLVRPRLLLADPVLPRPMREWILRLRLLTAQVQALWKMGDYRRASEVLAGIDAELLIEEEEVEVPLPLAEEKKKAKATSMTMTHPPPPTTLPSAGVRSPPHPTHTAVTSKMAASTSKFRHMITGHYIVPFSLRFMSALLPFHLHKSEERAEKRLSQLLEACDAEVEVEVQHLLYMAKLFLPSWVWEEDAALARDSITLGAEGVHDRQQHPHPHYHHDPNSPIHRVNSTPHQPQQQQQTIILTALVESQARALIEERRHQRRRRVLSALLYVRYALRRVTVTFETFKLLLQEEEEIAAAAASKASKAPPPRPHLREGTRRIPSHGPVPPDHDDDQRTLVEMDVAGAPSVTEESTSHLGPCSGASTTTTTRMVQANLDALPVALPPSPSPSLDPYHHSLVSLSVSACIDHTLILQRLACLCLQVGNSFFARQVQSTLADLGRRWVAQARLDREVIQEWSSHDDDDDDDNRPPSTAAVHGGQPDRRETCRAMMAPLLDEAAGAFFNDGELIVELSEMLLQGFMDTSSPDGYAKGTALFARVAVRAQEGIAAAHQRRIKAAAMQQVGYYQYGGSGKSMSAPQQQQQHQAKNSGGKRMTMTTTTAEPPDASGILRESQGGGHDEDDDDEYDAGGDHDVQKMKDEEGEEVDAQRVVGLVFARVEHEEDAALHGLHVLRTRAEVSHLAMLPYSAIAVGESTALTVMHPEHFSRRLEEQLREYLRVNPNGLVHSDAFLFVASRFRLFCGQPREEEDRLTDVVELMRVERASMAHLVEQWRS